MLKAPKLYNSVVCWKELYAITFVLVEKFYIIDFFLHLNTLKMIELRLMWLNFLKVAIIEVTRIFQISVPEHYNSASSISDCQVFSSFIIGNRSQDIWFINILNVPLTQAVNIDPASRFRLFHLITALGFTFSLRWIDLGRLLLRHVGSTTHLGVDNLFGESYRDHSVCLIHLIH